MFTMTQSLQIAHQIQADQVAKADRHRRARRARRSRHEAPRPANVVLLRAAPRQDPAATRVA
jgi:hypothetical protein